MPDEITPELFEQLVELAALELSSSEAEYLRRELNNQLKAIQELAVIPLEEHIRPTSHGVSYTAETSPPIRKDVHVACKNPEAILAQAPEVEDRYFVVPDIPHEELD